jgi:tetratricopeptide (TPR) repeat protein
LLRVRLGKREPSRRFIIAVTKVISDLAGEAVAAEQLFERAALLLESDATRLRAVHAQDLRALNHMLAHVNDDDWAQQVLDSGIASETAVRHLYYVGKERLPVAPKEAALIFHVASVMAAKLGQSTPPELKASLEATALKGRANALRHLGHFIDALANLRTASRLYIAARYCKPEAARVEYSRGGVFFAMERWVEAVDAANKARTLALEINDMQLVAHSDILIGVCFLEQGRTAAALDAFIGAERLLTALNDHTNLARVWLNLAAVDIQRGNAAPALDYLKRASTTFRKLGHHVELARATWNLGTYHAKFTDPAAALRQLRAARRAFASLGDRTNSACVALDILEIQSGIAPQGDRHLARFARIVANELIDLGLAVSAANALDQLQRIAVARNRRAIIEDVRLAMREKDIPCHSTWSEADTSEADEAEPEPGPASVA